jgi:hypothetical protein
MLIYVEISRDRNVIKKEAENILKYKYLATDIESTWNVTTKVIAIKTEATAKMSVSF